MATASFLPIPPKRLRTSEKFDIAIALKLRVHHRLSYAAIARQLGVNVNTVTKRLRELSRLLADPELVDGAMQQYSHLLDSAKLKALSRLSQPDKLEKSSAAQLAVIFGILDDKARLEKGQSTLNVKHLSLIIQAAHRSPGTKAPDNAEANDAVTMSTSQTHVHDEIKNDPAAR